jgi:hypothetical protein
MSKNKVTVEEAKKEGLEIVDTQIKRFGRINPEAQVKVKAIVSDLYLTKDKVYDVHPKVAEHLINLKKVVKLGKEGK